MKGQNSIIKGSSVISPSNIKQIKANRLTSILPEENMVF